MGINIFGKKPIKARCRKQGKNLYPDFVDFQTVQAGKTILFLILLIFRIKYFALDIAPIGHVPLVGWSETEH